MSKKIFTESDTISFTKEFKTIFYEEYLFSGSAEHMTPEESLRHLQHEVNYLKQEMEFLKNFPRSEVPGSRCCASE